MATYKLNFNQKQCKDLERWYEVDFCWFVDTLSSKEKLLVNEWCRDAIHSLQFILRYYDKCKKKDVELVSKVYNMIDPYEKTSVSRNWDKFDKEFNKMIMKYLKATNKNPKDNFSNLRSVLWNKMSNDLIAKVKYRLNPEKKIYQSIETKNVIYGTEGCKVDTEVKFADNSKATITFGFSANGEGKLDSGLNFWDIFDEVMVLSPDLNINEVLMTFETFHRNFDDIFKLFENVGQLHITLNTFFTTIAHNWQRKFIGETTEKDKEDSLKWMHFSYAFNEPFTSFDSTVWGTATVKVDFLKEKLEDATKAWFINQNNKNKSKDDFGNYLLDFIYGTLAYKYSIPSNPNLIDCKIEEMGRGDFRVEVGKRFCIMSQLSILESLKSELIKMFWNDDCRLPKDTREVLNKLGATNEQKAKVANEYEMLLKTKSFC